MADRTDLALHFDPVGETQTQALARALAPALREGDFLALCGELGAGKTSFARGLIGALTGAAEVVSPTYTLVQVYEGGSVPVWHLDLYRLGQPEEALDLGLAEALPRSILVVEWADKLGRELPRDRLEIVLEDGASADRRHLRLMGHGLWRGRLPPLKDRLQQALRAAPP